MAAEHEKLMAALGGKKKGPTHTHGVHYERADNGGYMAHVHKHHGKGPHSEGLSHVEEHVVPDAESAQAHLDEHMGDQPPVGGGGEMAGAGGGGAEQEQEPQPEMA